MTESLEALEPLEVDTACEGCAFPSGRLRARMLVCYRRALVRDPELGGILVLELELGRAGQVMSVLVTNRRTAPVNQELLACADRVARALRWPPNPEPRTRRLEFHLLPFAAPREPAR